MCKECVAMAMLDAAKIHIGYGDPDEDPYERILSGDIVFETPDTKRRFSQEGFFEFWQQLSDAGYGNIDESLPVEETLGCAICSERLVEVPGIEGTCERCGESKLKNIKEIADNREEVQAEMEEFFGEEGLGPGKKIDPLELALRAGLHCPNDHWVCSDCLQFHRDELPEE